DFSYLHLGNCKEGTEEAPGFGPTSPSVAGAGYRHARALHCRIDERDSDRKLRAPLAFPWRSCGPDDRGNGPSSRWAADHKGRAFAELYSHTLHLVGKRRRGMSGLWAASC